MTYHDTPLGAELVNAFLGLQLTGGVGFTIIVLTALGSHNVQRNSTWYTLCAAWILSSLSYTLIFLAGQQHSPGFGICLTQAAGIYSAPSLTSCATLSFAIEMLIGVRAASTNISLKRKQYFTLALLILPFFIWLFLFLGFLFVSALSGPNGTYCDLNSFVPSKISGLLVAVTMLFILLIEGYIGTCLFRGRKVLQDRQLITMAMRGMVFSLLGVLGLGIGFAYVLFSEEGPVFDILIALQSQDLFNVWLFWRRPRGAEVTEDSKSIGSA
ncbi:hypothetical protein B0H17DRAFT_1143648 [Mycena rosella]|uniref:Uncharacterized protein n=1 Tax=Mycena rosella TaxID=1033263 RepID=A0AAD7CUQ9_MYCRO|nr:hypothetical protein B0H17DRAFT_1143648 [Mycena rosella]